ncbi:hypothetical protein BG006_005560, partial [Podila minutissima]
MAKFTSILLLATAALASFSAAAPTAATTTVTEFITVAATAPVATPTAAATEAEEPLYQGKATWFTDSYGSCGETWHGYSEPSVALSAQMMGVQAWGHPACNRRVHITLRDDPFKSVTARVVD